MVMRISTVQAFNNGVGGLGRNYSDVIKTQEQISSGSRILTAADDPVATVRLLQLEQQESVLGQYKSNLTAAKNSLVEEESTLNSVNTVMQRIRDLAVQAGGGALSAEDRKSIASELKEREGELLNLMNSRSAGGEYLFGGNLGKTAPFTRNPDGTYSYQGDEGQRSLQVATSSTVAVNDNGKSLFESVPNANRVQSQSGVDNPNLPTPPLQATAFAAKTSADQRVFVSSGLVQDNQTYNSTFRSGEPYSMVMLSGKEFAIYDKNGTDVSSDIAGGGKIDPTASSGNVIDFRGMRFQVDVILKDGDNPQDLDNLLADASTAGTPGTHAFTLQTTPTDFSVTRSSGNTSSARLAASGISNQAVFNSQFPTSGVMVRYNGADFEVYSQPYKAGNAALQTAAVNPGPPDTVEVFGASFEVSGTLGSGDQFTVQPQFQEQRSILNTVSRLRQALESSSDTPAGNLAVRDEVSLALTNIDNGMEKVLSVQGQIGARMNLIETTQTDNEDVTLVNKSVQADLRELDYAEALSRLSFQTIVLEAAQQSYVKVASLSLFNQLR